MRAVWGAIAIAAAMAAAACGPGRRSAPIMGELAMQNEQQRHGQQVFMEQCNQCHPGGDAGLGPAINNKPIPEAIMRLQVRGGIGAMPAIPAHALSERELDDLVEYLEILRAG
jgi:mono/diheme cytochrome c family protein